MFAYKLLFLNVFFAVLCIGCAARQPIVLQPGGFEVKGKLAVRDAQENFSARFHWRQTGDRFQIDLWGPLGQGRVQLIGTADQIALLDGAGQVVIEGSQEEVMRAQLGWSMPLAVFPAWLRGEPKSGVPATDLQRDAAGLVRSFRQLDWLISYEQYRAVETASEMRTLPRKLSATNGATRVRIVISEWRI